MSPADRRENLRNEHQQILERAALVVETAEAVATGETSRRPQLERELANLREEIEAHLEREDVALPALLADGEPQAHGCAAGLRAAHGELLEVLDFCRGTCAQGEHALLLAGRARDFVDLLRAQIGVEDDMALRPVRSGSGEAAVVSRLSRPFQPVALTGEVLRFFRLPDLAEELRTEGGYRRSGVGSVTLARGEQVTMVLVALRAGATMREHRAPSAATVVFLSGRATFVSGDNGVRTDLASGALVAFSADVPHAIEAAEDSTYLVVIGGRERPAVVS